MRGGPHLPALGRPPGASPGEAMLTSLGEMPAILTRTLSRTLFMRSSRAARSSECIITALFLARSQRSLVACELTLPMLPAGLSAGLGAGAAGREKLRPGDAGG